jgi:hypothetical protein
MLTSRTDTAALACPPVARRNRRAPAVPRLAETTIATGTSEPREHGAKSQTEGLPGILGPTASRATRGRPRPLSRVALPVWRRMAARRSLSRAQEVRGRGGGLRRGSADASARAGRVGGGARGARTGAARGRRPSPRRPGRRSTADARQHSARDPRHVGARRRRASGRTREPTERGHPHASAQIEQTREHPGREVAKKQLGERRAEAEEHRGGQRVADARRSCSGAAHGTRGGIAGCAAGSSNGLKGRIIRLLRARAGALSDRPQRGRGDRSRRPRSRR